MNGKDEEGGRFAVPGEQSNEDEDTLTEEERGEQARPPEYSEPKQPAPEQ